jgi:Type II secretion system (T2SS), protein K
VDRFRYQRRTRSVVTQRAALSSRGRLKDVWRLGVSSPYRIAGLDYDAKDAAFDSVAELEQVLGMTHELFRQVQPFVTVYTGLDGINPLNAPREVLTAAALTTEQSDSGPGNQEAYLIGAASPLTDLSPEAADATPPPAVTIRAEAQTSGGGRFQREAVVLLTYGTFAIREWRRRWDASPRSSPPSVEQ